MGETDIGFVSYNHVTYQTANLGLVMEYLERFYRDELPIVMAVL